MWASFLAAAVFCLAALYVPGFLLFRAMGLSRIVSLACAPFYGVASYELLSIILACLGIRSSFLALFAPVLLFAAGVFLIRCITEGSLSRCGGRRALGGSGCGIAHDEDPASLLSHGGWDFEEKMRIRFLCGSVKRIDLGIFAGYVAVGVAATVFMYVMCLDGADSFVQSYDNVHHYGLARSFSESGIWSPLNASLYLGDDAAFDTFSGAGFYPAAWHTLVALTSDAANVSITVSANVVNVLFAGVVYPVGMSLLLFLIFPRTRSVVAMGALATSAFYAYPWTLFMTWPLYPNAVSTAAIPLFVACFIALWTRGLNRGARFSLLVACVLGLVSFVFLQPNSVFAAAVVLIPFCVWRVGKTVSLLFENVFSCAKRRLVAALAAVAFLVVSVMLWLFFFQASFMQGVVRYYWPPLGSIWEVLASTLNFGFTGLAGQYVLAAFVAGGAFWSLLRRRQPWLVFSLVIAMAIYVVAASFGDVPLKHLLAGFWYTDPYRVAAMIVLTAVPLAAMGMACLCRGFVAVATKLDLGPKGSARIRVAAFLSLGVLCAGALFLPGIFEGTALGYARGVSQEMNRMEGYAIYDAEESAFVEKVREVVDERDLIINLPFDGSLFAYSADGLNVYSRYISGYGGEDEAWESRVLRLGTSGGYNEEDVELAVRSVGADYVLLLHRGSDKMSTAFFTYRPEDWSALLAIGDESRGLEKVLAEGDMRLYRIVS